MNDNVMVSVIVPVYGTEQYIERCARSLFEQTCDNIEYIFVDDCTPDKSIDKLREVLRHYPHREENVKIKKNIANFGQAEVRNVGVSHCQGQFLMHVDSDDWLDTDVIERCVDKQKTTGADIVAFDRKLYKTGQIVEVPSPETSSSAEFTIQMLRRERDISIWGMLIRTSLYKDYGITCKKGINMSEDYQTSPRLAYYAKKVAFVHGTFYNYECRNMKSISAIFTSKNVHQELVTLDVLDGFFHNKEEGMREAFEYGRCKMLCYYRHNAAYYDVHDVYNEVSTMIKELSSTIKNQMPLPYKIGLMISSERILKSYVGILKLLKKKFK